MAFLLSIIAGLSTMLGCIFLFIKVKNYENFIVFSIGLALSVMISVSIFDLLPATLPYLVTKNIIYSLCLTTICFLIGYILIMVIDKFIEKENKKITKDNKTLFKIGLLNFLTLIIHNVPEGILTFMGTYQDFKLGLSLCIAIALHNIPEGISIAIPIYYSTKRKGKAILMTFLSSMAEPVGAVLAFWGLRNFMTDQIISIFLIITAGMMITLSINKMLPTALKYQKNKFLGLGIIIGVLAVLLSLQI